MTKEELEKEAEEYIKKNKLEWELECNRTSPIGEVVQAYLAGAEQREKRIAELIALINAERKRQEQCDNIHLRKIAELEKDNRALKALRKYEGNVASAEIEKLQEKNEKLEKKNEEAKKIIKDFLLWENSWHEKTESKYALLKRAEDFIKK